MLEARSLACIPAGLLRVRSLRGRRPSRDALPRSRRRRQLLYQSSGAPMTSTALSLLVLTAAARAQSVERPTLPFRSIAGEDGVHTLYLNPALLNFDRDAGYAAW